MSNIKISACNKCGWRYNSAPAATLHKCGKCLDGLCYPIAQPTLDDLLAVGGGVERSQQDPGVSLAERNEILRTQLAASQAQLAQLREVLGMIEAIGDGSKTAKSLPNIADIARAAIKDTRTEPASMIKAAL